MLFKREIADLKHRITIQKPARVSNGMGGFAVTWTNVATVWARILPVSAKEARESEREAMTISHTVSIRWRSDLRPTWRLKHKTAYLSIVGIVNPELANEWLDINCLEIKP